MTLAASHHWVRPADGVTQQSETAGENIKEGLVGGTIRKSEIISHPKRVDMYSKAMRKCVLYKICRYFLKM